MNTALGTIDGITAINFQRDFEGFLKGVRTAAFKRFWNFARVKGDISSPNTGFLLLVFIRLHIRELEFAVYRVIAFTR